MDVSRQTVGRSATTPDSPGFHATDDSASARTSNIHSLLISLSKKPSEYDRIKSLRRSSTSSVSDPELVRGVSMWCGGTVAPMKTLHGFINEFRDAPRRSQQARSLEQSFFCELEGVDSPLRCHSLVVSPSAEASRRVMHNPRRIAAAGPASSTGRPLPPETHYFGLCFNPTASGSLIERSRGSKGVVSSLGHCLGIP